jgi:hypothetical protein
VLLRQRVQHRGVRAASADRLPRARLSDGPDVRHLERRRVRAELVRLRLERLGLHEGLRRRDLHDGPVMLARAGLFLWELPQNVLGIANLALQRAAGNVRGARFERERLMIELEGDGAVSLGLFVFFATKDNRWVPVGPENRDHEYGHSIQSRRLGPLYLPLVGLPSTARVLYAIAHHTLRGKRWDGYYRGWPERSADVLGGADTSLRPAP